VNEVRARWERIHAAAAEAGPPEAARVLAENAHLLPTTGRALDLASGPGGNALLLARVGLETHAWDIAPTAIARLERQAAALGLTIQAATRDVEAAPPPPGGFDVIVVSRFLSRPLAGALIAALRPGGLLYYQTFTREKAFAGGPSNPDYLLAPGELLRMFSALRPVTYREEGWLGDVRRGFRNQALFVGLKEE
jgi:SAM-dependent methyltransferase